MGLFNNDIILSLPRNIDFTFDSSKKYYNILYFRHDDKTPG